jgi:hypothetical protein
MPLSPGSAARASLAGSSGLLRSRRPRSTRCGRPARADRHAVERPSVSSEGFARPARIGEGECRRVGHASAPDHQLGKEPRGLRAAVKVGVSNCVNVRVADDGQREVRACRVQSSGTGRGCVDAQTHLSCPARYSRARTTGCEKPTGVTTHATVALAVRTCSPGRIRDLLERSRGGPGDPKTSNRVCQLPNTHDGSPIAGAARAQWTPSVGVMGFPFRLAHPTAL